MREDGTRPEGWGSGPRVFGRIVGLVLFLILAGPVFGFLFSRFFFFLRPPHRWVVTGLLILRWLATRLMSPLCCGMTA